MNNIFITLYLFLASIFDVKTRKIPLILIIIFSIIEIIYFTNFHFVLGLIPGFLMIIISRITCNSIGYGDSFLILSLGFSLSIYTVFQLLLLGLFFSSIIGCLLLLKNKNKKYKLPFLPFLFIAWLTLI